MLKQFTEKKLRGRSGSRRDLENMVVCRTGRFSERRHWVLVSGWTPLRTISCESRCSMAGGIASVLDYFQAVKAPGDAQIHA